MAAVGQQSAIDRAAARQEKKIENSHFLNELRDPDVDSEVFDWISEEQPTWFSGARAVTNRPHNWDQIADLSMQNKRERAMAERSPGRLLRSRPRLLAIAQGVDSPQDPKFREPITSAKARRLYESAEIAADLMTLSRDGAGLDATTTATTETRVKRESEAEETGSKVSRRLFG